MKILYIAQYFPPEMGAPSARVYELSKYWVKLGHDVTVLTTFPNYPDGVVYKEYESKIWKLFLKEKLDGINVIRVWSFPTHLRSFTRRATNYISFTLSSSIALTFLKKFDVVIATSPPPLVGLTGLYCSRLKCTPCVFEVRDLWPDVTSALGAVNENSFSYKLLKRIISLSYNKCDIIIAVTESFKTYITNQNNISPDKIHVVENAVDTDIFKSLETSPQDRKKLGLEGKFVVSYIGTIGLTHGVEVIINAALELETKIPNLVFLIVGDGADKDRLSKITKQHGINNVIFLGIQPRDKVPMLINISDVSLVLSSVNPFFKKTIFAKVFEPMACGKATIVAAEGETRRIVVDRGNAGIGITPESKEQLIKAVEKLYNNSELRNELGRNGAKFVREEFSREKKAAEYIKIIQSLTS